MRVEALTIDRPKGEAVEWRILGLEERKEFDWVVEKRRFKQKGRNMFIGDLLKDFALTSYGEIFNRQHHAVQGV